MSAEKRTRFEPDRAAVSVFRHLAVSLGAFVFHLAIGNRRLSIGNQRGVSQTMVRASKIGPSVQQRR
jgi:hypothetical protein